MFKAPSWNVCRAVQLLLLLKCSSCAVPLVVAVSVPATTTGAVAAVV